MSYKSSKPSSNESHVLYVTYTQVESLAQQQVSYCKGANALEFLNVVVSSELLLHYKSIATRS
jgi:hypothetical protein